MTLGIVIGAALMLAIDIVRDHYRNRIRARREIRQQFMSDASKLFYSLQLHQSKLEPSQSARIKKAISVLKGPISDDCVVTFHLNICPEGDEYGPYFIINYVDKQAHVTHINYSTGNQDCNSLGQVCISRNDLPSPEYRHHGIFTLYVHLRPNIELDDKARPYTEIKNDINYLVLPHIMYTSIMKRRGQFIIFGKDGNILDKVPLKDVACIPWTRY